jgi:hypothetical protein
MTEQSNRAWMKGWGNQPQHFARWITPEVQQELDAMKRQKLDEINASNGHLCEAIKLFTQRADQPVNNQQVREALGNWLVSQCPALGESPHKQREEALKIYRAMRGLERERERKRKARWRVFWNCLLAVPGCAVPLYGAFKLAEWIIR